MFDRLRPTVRVFHDEAGREVFDLPDAPRPAPDVAAPPRFMPEYDNVFLGHADRTRVVSEEHRTGLRAAAGTRTVRTVMLDGVVAGSWAIVRNEGTATLVVEPVVPVSKATREDLIEEEGGLLTLLAAGRVHDVVVA